jgi:alcohol dehydrogenase class IV
MLVGSGASKQLADEVKRLGKKKVLMLTDVGLASVDFVAESKNSLEQAGLKVCLFGGIHPHPTDKNVVDAVEAGKKFGMDILVSIGGGSSIDAARGTNLVFSYGGDIRDHAVGAGKCVIDRKDLLPHIAIPTTAGTGGEVAGGGGIYGLDARTGKTVEIGIGDANLVPDVAIIDALLTISLPPYITAYTGMDAMTHAIESIFSTRDFAFSDGLGYEAIKIVENNLRIAVKEPQNIVARENMLIAACMANVALGQTLLGLCHSMTTPLSVMAHVPHGVGNALLLPHIYRLNASARPDRAMRIAKALGITDDDSRDFIGRATVRITQLLVDTGLPVYLDDTAFTKDMIPEASEMAKRCRFTVTNPVILSAEEIGQIYLGCFRQDE